MTIRHVGFLGLGLMGSRMALNLKKKGFEVTVWNRSAARAEALKSHGIHVAKTPAQVAQVADAFCTCVADVAALRPKLLGVFEHFYPDCFAGDIGVSTHYVVIAHRIDVAAGFEVPGIDDQHESLRWWPIAEAAADKRVHRYSQDYLPLLV